MAEKYFTSTREGYSGVKLGYGRREETCGAEDKVVLSVLMKKVGKRKG